MSDSVRPHRRQPTRFPRPWDSPGKNTGVGCHFLLQCMKGKSESKVAQSCQTLCDPMDHSLPGSSIHGILHARVLEWVTISFSDYNITMHKPLGFYTTRKRTDQLMWKKITHNSNNQCKTLNIQFTKYEENYHFSVKIKKA